jgi:hypothetical protein
MKTISWIDLWAIATGEEGAAPATIIPDSERPNRVTLIFADGSSAGLYCVDGIWHFEEPVSTCPGDVAARDSL